MQPRFDLVRVTSVRHVRDHVLWLEFNDGVSGTLDLSDALVGAMFERLRDPVEFARARLGAETIECPNGAGWAPESLYLPYEQFGSANAPAGDASTVRPRCL